MSPVFKIFSLLCIFGSFSAQEISVITVIEVEDSTKSKKTYFSDFHVDSSTVNNNEIIIIGGNLNVDGTINGKITIIGGDVYLGSTAVINGEILAIGGTITRHKSAIVKGKINQTNLKEGLLYKEIKDQEFENDSLKSDNLSYNSLIHTNKDLFVHNRNEGLVFTPINTYWDKNGKSSFTLRFELGYRFGSSEGIGQLTFDKSFFFKNLGIFASIFKKSRSDDKYRLPTSENSWASFLARQDFYDRWDEEGWSFGAVINFDQLKFKIEMNYVDVDSIGVIDNIWSLFERKRKTRLNPSLINSETTDYLHMTLNFRTKNYAPLSSGLAINIDGELNQKNKSHRIISLVKLNWEITKGIVLRTNIINGISSGNLEDFRKFGLGGLGSVSAFPYKYQLGDQMIQTNGEIIFTEYFLNEWFFLKIFFDGGYAWSDNYMQLDDDKSSSFEQEDVMEKGISSFGIGVGSSDQEDIDWAVNIAKPLDGRKDYETTIRFNYNF